MSAMTPTTIGEGQPLCTCGAEGEHRLFEHDDRIRGKVAAGVSGANTEGLDPRLAERTIHQWFAYGHLPEGPIRDTSKACADLAAGILAQIPDDPELDAGLRRLLEAKDCFVRATIAGQRKGN